VTESVKPLRPLTTAVELKEATVRDYSRAARRHGQTPDMAALERLAIADLTTVDAFKREQRAAPTKERRAPRKRDAGTLEKAQQETGVKVVAPSSARQRPEVLYANAVKRFPRWPYAMGRMKRILEGAGQGKTLEDGLANAAMPALAREYFLLWGHFLTRNQRSKHNPFLGLSEKDASRAFMRGVEDICDRSTGVLGPWWVPK